MGTEIHDDQFIKNILHAQNSLPNTGDARRDPSTDMTRNAGKEGGDPSTRLGEGSRDPEPAERGGSTKSAEPDPKNGVTPISTLINAYISDPKNLSLETNIVNHVRPQGHPDGKQIRATLRGMLTAGQITQDTEGHYKPVATNDPKPDTQEMVVED